MGRTQQYPYYHKDKPWPPAQDRRAFLVRPYKGRRSVVLTVTAALLILGAVFFLWPAHNKPNNRPSHLHLHKPRPVAPAQTNSTLR